jgi:hypothetical protein
MRLPFRSLAGTTKTPPRAGSPMGTTFDVLRSACKEPLILTRRCFWDRLACATAGKIAPSDRWVDTMALVFCGAGRECAAPIVGKHTTHTNAHSRRFLAIRQALQIKCQDCLASSHILNTTNKRLKSARGYHSCQICFWTGTIVRDYLTSRQRA